MDGSDAYDADGEKTHSKESGTSSSSRGLTIAAVTANNNAVRAALDAAHSEEVLTQPEILASLSRMATEESAEDDQEEEIQPQK